MNPTPCFWDLLTPTVLDHLSHHLDIPEIVNLSRTCRGLSGFYEAMLPRKWSIDLSLRPFVDKPQAFRQQIGITEALLAGEFPQEFFERRGKTPTILDIVTTKHATPELATYLAIHEEYMFDVGSVPNLIDLPYRHIEIVNHVNSFYTLGCLYSQMTQLTRIRDGTQTHIRILSTSDFSFPIRGIMEGSWTTASVCLMSWRMAYCVFPSLSFFDRRCFMLGQPATHLMPKIQDFQTRGYVFETATSAHAQGENGHSMQKCRRLSDRFTWKVPFVENEEYPVFAADPVRNDDMIYISENTAELNGNTIAQLQSLGLADSLGEAARFAHHYDAKYMRWNKIYC